MIRVVVADDHQLLREGVKKVLSVDPEFVVAGEAVDLESTLHLLETVEADVLLLDLTLSPVHELDALEKVVRRFPGLPVLVLSAYSEERFGIAALKLGAVGFISKRHTADVVSKAIHRVHAGGRYLSENLAEILARSILSDQPRNALERLTERELQVLRLIAVGLPVKQVAGRLGISNSSVNTYRGRLLKKLQLKSNADLIRYAIYHHVVK